MDIQLQELEKLIRSKIVLEDEVKKLEDDIYRLRVESLKAPKPSEAFTKPYLYSENLDVNTFARAMASILKTEDFARISELLAHIRNGRKIDAIKLFRELSGEGLRTSKQSVEALLGHEV